MGVEAVREEEEGEGVACREDRAAERAGEEQGSMRRAFGRYGQASTEQPVAAVVQFLWK